MNNIDNFYNLKFSIDDLMACFGDFIQKYSNKKEKVAIGDAQCLLQQYGYTIHERKEEVS